MAVIAMTIAIAAPRIYKDFIRQTVGSKVVAITQTEFSKNREDSGGGTGFHVVAPSGKTYIMTNRHVCDNSKDGTLWVTIDGSTSDQKLKVLERSLIADLCLMEGIPGIKGLLVGDTPAINDDLIYVGHPRLQQRTLVMGELVGSKLEVVIRGEVGKEITADQCKAKDSYIAQTSEVYMFLHRLRRGKVTMPPVALTLEGVFGNTNQVPVCYERDVAYVTTLSVYGGASGSPVVNLNGEVVGVIYAGGEGEWGYAVVLSDIKALLNGR